MELNWLGDLAQTRLGRSSKQVFTIRRGVARHILHGVRPIDLNLSDPLEMQADAATISPCSAE